MKRCGKISVLILLAFMGFFGGLLPACAVGEAPDAQIGAAWGELVGALPPEVVAYLPEGFFEADMERVGAGVEQASTLTSILGVVGELTGITLTQSLALLARLVGVLVLCATFRAAIGEQGGGTGAAITLVFSFSVVLLLTAGQGERFVQIERFFDTVRVLCLSLIPLMGALYAMGGNVGAAVATQGVMSGFLALLETACSGVVVPVAKGLLVLAVADAAAGTGSLRGIASLLRRTFTWGLSFLMMLLLFVLGVQHTLSVGVDTLAMRTVRFAAGSFLPVVGGSVSESLKTVAGSVTYLRTVVGTGGVLLVFFLFLRPFLSVLLTRLCFMLGGAAAGLLGLAREERLLAEIAAVWGYFLAVIACLFSMTFFSLSLLAHTATAI